MNNNVPVYMDYLYLMDSLRGYASPKARLTRMIKTGEIVKVRRGLYIGPGNVKFSLKTLANKMYGPSYISFEYALSWYGLIPERAHTITSASMGKNKSKIFNTSAGVFLYQSINSIVYPYGIIRMEEDESPFLIASREKALCDLLCKKGGITDAGKLENLLYDDLRIEKDSIFTLDLKDMEFLAPLYGKKAVSLLLMYLKKGNSDA